MDFYFSWGKVSRNTMGKKKNKNRDEQGENNVVEEHNGEENGGYSQETEDGGNTDGGGGGGGGKNAVVLKIDLHCEGCATKIIKRIKAFEGVVKVELDVASQKFSVTGKVDPVKLRDTLQKKLNKKVELLTPVPKKTQEDGKGKDNSGGKDDQNKKSGDKNAKEPPVTTAVLKILLHCEGCMEKIVKIITGTKGFQEMKMDREKDLVTVTGAMEMKALVESMKKKLKKDVEIVPPKKDEKKDKGNGNGGGEEKVNKSQVQGGQGYPVMQYQYVNVGEQVAYEYGYQLPQMFSDENPNACSIM